MSIQDTIKQVEEENNEDDIPLSQRNIDILEEIKRRHGERVSKKRAEKAYDEAMKGI